MQRLPPIKIFGESTRISPNNHCLIYQTRQRIFEYHNFSKDEANRVEIFSPIIEDKRIRTRISIHCRVCQQHNSMPKKEEETSPISQQYRDNKEVKRVNDSLKFR